MLGLNEGKIKNCNIDGVFVKGTEKVGGIAGISMPESLIENCNTKKYNFITAEKYCGGIVGYLNNNSTLTNVNNNAIVNGDEYIGGIGGIAFFGSEISSSSNDATRIIGKKYVGGLVGYSQAQIEKSYNSSSSDFSVMGNDYIGGLVGINYNLGNIIDCYNSGKVIATENNCGGIAGVNNSTIMNCFNKGNVSLLNKKSDKIGGICGQNSSESFIYNSYVHKIVYDDNCNKIVGTDFGSISKSFFLQKENIDEILVELGDSFTKDNENINSGYPILKWMEKKQ